MNKQVMIGVSVGLLLLAVLIFAFTRKGGGGDMDMSAEMNKPRVNSPTFAPDVAPPPASRNAKGVDTGAVSGAGGGSPAASGAQ